jgi:hypothetical protein
VNKKIKSSYAQIWRDGCVTYGILISEIIATKINFKAYLFIYTNKRFIEFLGLNLFLRVGKSSVFCVYHHAE